MSDINSLCVLKLQSTYHFISSCHVETLCTYFDCSQIVVVLLNVFFAFLTDPFNTMPEKIKKKNLLMTFKKIYFSLY